MLHRQFTIALILLSVIASGTQAVIAAEFKLASRFLDADGDLVADAPTDPAKQMDPGTLIFAYTPVEDPAVYAKVWDGFLAHMEKMTGKKVVFFPVQSNAAQIEAMRAGRLHVAGFNTGSNPLAVNCAGFVPFTMMALAGRPASATRWKSSLSGLAASTKVEDLKGKKIAFTARDLELRLQGAVGASCKAEFELEAGKDFEPVFSGKHDNSVLGVANKDYPAAAIANAVLQAHDRPRGGQGRSDQARSTSRRPFPTTGYGYVYNLKPELAEKIKEAFFTFPWEGSALLKEFGQPSRRARSSCRSRYKKHWEVDARYRRGDGRLATPANSG